MIKNIGQGQGYFRLNSPQNRLEPLTNPTTKSKEAEDSILLIGDSIEIGNQLYYARNDISYAKELMKKISLVKKMTQTHLPKILALENKIKKHEKNILFCKKINITYVADEMFIKKAKDEIHDLKTKGTYIDPTQVYLNKLHTEFIDKPTDSYVQKGSGSYAGIYEVPGRPGTFTHKKH